MPLPAFYTFVHHYLRREGGEVLQNSNAAFTGTAALKHEEIYVKYSTAPELTDKNSISFPLK